MTTDHRSFLLSALAIEVQYMGVELSKLGDVLVGDELVVERHVVELQRFDVLVQGMEEIARALEGIAAGIQTADIVDRIRLDAVQARVSRALMAA